MRAWICSHCGAFVQAQGQLRFARSRRIGDDRHWGRSRQDNGLGLAEEAADSLAEQLELGLRAVPLAGAGAHLVAEFVALLDDSLELIDLLPELSALVLRRAEFLLQEVPSCSGSPEVILQLGV